MWTGETDLLFLGSSLLLSAKSVENALTLRTTEKRGVLKLGTTENHWKSFSAEISSVLGGGFFDLLIAWVLILGSEMGLELWFSLHLELLHLSILFQILVGGGHVAFT